MITADCELCERVSADNFVFYRDPSGLWVGMKNLFPEAIGHSMLSTVAHRTRYEQLTHDELLAYGPAKADVLRHLGRSSLVEEHEELLRAPIRRPGKPLRQTDRPAHPMSERKLQEAAVRAPADKGVVPDHSLIANNGLAAGQSISHFHDHVIPRWFGDVENPAGGAVTRLFPGAEYWMGQD